MDEFNNVNLKTCNNPCPRYPCWCHNNFAIDLTTTSARGDCGEGADCGADLIEHLSFHDPVVGESDSEDDDCRDDALFDSEVPDYQVPNGFPGYVDILDPAWQYPGDDIGTACDPNHINRCELEPDYSAADVERALAEDLSGGAFLSDADFNAALQAWAEIAEQLGISTSHLD